VPAGTAGYGRVAVGDAVSLRLGSTCAIEMYQAAGCLFIYPNGRPHIRTLGVSNLLPEAEDSLPEGAFVFVEYNPKRPPLPRLRCRPDYFFAPLRRLCLTHSI
jgi:hypothetical protein